VRALAVVWLLTAGCAADWGYVAGQATGQLAILAAAEPISRVLHEGTAEPVVAHKLHLVQAARAFAHELGLDVSQRYQDVVMLPRRATVYVVTAAPTDSLDTIQWTYPVVGTLPYRGFFDEEQANGFAASLRSPDVETSVRPVSTYSLLGFWPDPVVSPMLADEDTVLVETLFHELAHATVFAPGQGAFNEGLATFIGREARRQFLRARLGDASHAAMRARDLDQDEDAYGRAVAALAFEVRLLFAESSRKPRTHTDKAKLQRERARIFAAHQRHWRDEVAPTLHTSRYRYSRLPDNNARLAEVGLYTLRQRLYVDAFVACGRDMRVFLAILRRAAQANDAQEWLRTTWRGTAP
jgi:predicted aminopeptidase